MNIVSKVRYQNFLAAGNAPIEVPLDTHPTTLVVGKNGGGKSTLHEAICFAWFGKPLRRVNRGALVNWINNRDCLVELEWSVTNGTKYLVRRGIKPNIFELYKNGTLEPAPSNIDDYQTQLENIIKLNYKSFMQVVVLGGSSYVPFMRLTAAARREIIEDLLDIEVFSSMNALAKEDLLELKTSLDKNVTMRTLLTEQVKMAQSFEEQIDEQIKQQVEALNVQIAGVTETIADLDKDADELAQALLPYTKVRAEFASAGVKIADYQKTLYQLEQRNLKTQKERQFYQEHNICPTCEQGITIDFKQKRYDTLTLNEESVTKAITQCHGLVEKYVEVRAACVKRLEGRDRIEDAIDAIETKIPIHRKHLRELEQEKLRVSTPKDVAPKIDTDALVAQLAGLHEIHTELSQERVIVDAATMLLKDNGIKTRIVKHYLPIINKHINHYLTAMDFPIAFSFDESFQEHIKTHHGEDFEYEQVLRW